MGRETGISWTDATWNPIRGCSRVSEGCRNCYAEGVAYRFSGSGGAYEGLVRIGSDGKRRREWNGQVMFVENHLLDPLKWKEPKRIFVNSMSDLFHENVTDEMRDRIFAVMALCPQHTFQVLTKRPDRMLRYMTEIRQGPERSLAGGVVRDMVYRWDRYNPTIRMPKGVMHEHRLDSFQWPPRNVHLGVSCENQATADERIPLLLRTPAAVRFISAEPLLGEIQLNQSIGGTRWIGGQRGCGGTHRGTGTEGCPTIPHHHHDDRCNNGIDWVIVGGESGPGARPMQAEWARSLRDQCQAASVSFFFKQWGEFRPNGSGTITHCETGLEIPLRDFGELIRIGTKHSGATLDGREHREFPGEVAR